MNTNFYGELAGTLIKNGYPVVPVRPYSKIPAATAWTSRTFTGVETAWGNCGVGIRCGIETSESGYAIYAIDIDVVDEGASTAICDAAFNILGPTMIRIGSFPKQLLVYRGAPGIKKLKSEAFADSDTIFRGGKAQRVEILGDGQFFVAYGVHPDTRNLYIYPAVTLRSGKMLSTNGPIDVRVAELPEVDEHSLHGFLAAIPSIVAGFSYLAMVGASKAGNVRPNRAARPRAVEATEDSYPEPETIGFVPPCVGITLENATDYLDWYDDNPNYDDWLMIGMALHHQFGGSDEALQLWSAWSATQPKYVDFEDLRRRWDGFTATTGSKTPVTFKSVIAKHNLKRSADTAGVFRDAATVIASIGLPSDFNSCITILRDMLAGADRLAVEYAAGQLAKKCRKIGFQLSKIEARRLLSTSAPSGSDEEKLCKSYWLDRAPPWARGYAFCMDDSIFNYLTKSFSKISAFDRAFSRFVPNSDGESSIRASSYLVEGDLVPIVDKISYRPGEGFLFRDADQRNSKGPLTLNIYDPDHRADPLLLDGLDEPEQKRVKELHSLLTRHIGALITGRMEGWNEECDYLMAFLRHNYEFPGEKIKFVPLLYSAPGAGKSLITELMSRALGSSNVGSQDGCTLIGAIESGFTSWTVGHCLLAIEELRFHGRNSRSLMNALLDKITNPTVLVNAKYRSPYIDKNTQNYIAYTNHVDALPLTADDRRWMFIMCRGNPKEIKREDSSHYDKLFNLLDDPSSGEIIASWLLSFPYEKRGFRFDPNSHAPKTEERDILIGISSPMHDDESIEQMISLSSDPLVGERVLAMERLIDILMLDISTNLDSCKDQSRGNLRLEMIPVLRNLGFKYLPKQIMVKDEKGNIVRFRPWIKNGPAGPDAAAAWARDIVRDRVAECLLTTRNKRNSE